MIIYPDCLPLPQSQTYVQKTLPNTIESPFSNGAIRQRQLNINPFWVDSVQFIFSQNQWAVFDGFVTHTLNSGMSWFEMTINTPVGPKKETVKIKMPILGVTPVGLNFIVQTEILIKRKTRLTAIESVELAREGPDSIERANNALSEVY